MTNMPKITVWGTYDTNIPRINILINALKEQEYDLKIINRDIWQDHRDKSQIISSFAKLKLAISLILAYAECIKKYIFSPKSDYVLISYPGILDILIIYPLSKLRGEKVLWDVFIPLYECIVEDRNLSSDKSVFARILYISEYIAAHLADKCFLDTKTHAKYFEKQFKLTKKPVGSVFVGTQDCFYTEPSDKQLSNTYDVLFYGKFIPLQGIDTIVKAAKILQNKNIPDIRIILVGQGQEQPRIDSIIKNLNITNIERINWLDYSDLISAIDNADLCLGVFGDTCKTQNVIPNKVFQVLAKNKLVITLDTPAIRELYELDKFDNLILIENNKPETLAEAIIKTKESSISSHTNIRIDKNLVGKQFTEMLKPISRDIPSQH